MRQEHWHGVRQGRRISFSRQPGHELEGTVNNMFWRIYGDSKSEPERAPNIKLNEAFMIALAVLAEKRGDQSEGRRLREMITGIKLYLQGK